MMLSFLTFIFIVNHSNGAYCNGAPDPNAQSNDHGFMDASPKLLSTVPNGKLYLAGPTEQEFYLLHLYGDAYQMGFAHGQLLKNELINFYAQVEAYILSELPFSRIYPEIENATLQEALEITGKMTAPWTPDRYYDEMQGLSDATGIPFDDILNIHMLPSLTRGHCSMFGASGDATKESQNGELIQLRALDWDTEGPFKDFPMVTVYHPNQGHGHPFANIAFVGFIGSITGVSSSMCSISEIGVSYPDASFGSESRFGAPFPFVLRDILQFDESVNDATKRMNETRRTCDLILGVGCGNDGQNGKFRGYEYSHTTLNVYDWDNLEPYNASADPQWHPRIKDIVYWGMDWLCPGYDMVLSEQLQKVYGQINAQNTISDIVAKTQTGNLHIAVYDYFEEAVYISFHSRSDQKDVVRKMAYERPYVKFQLKELFDDSD